MPLSIPCPQVWFGRCTFFYIVESKEQDAKLELKELKPCKVLLNPQGSLNK